MRVLVTGGSGMLGRVLVRHLAPRYEVTSLSRSGRDGSLVCDLRFSGEVAKVFDAQNFGLVIHTAAYSDVDGCERDPKLAHESNAVATKNLATECGKRVIPLVHVSTDYVFDGLKNSPYLETDPVGPVNIYGLTKLEAEYHVKRLARCSAVVRTSWIFGPDNPSSFVNAIAAKLKTEKVVRVLDDQEDSPTSAKDLAEALTRIGEYAVDLLKKNPNAQWHEIFQVCNTGSTTRFGMTEKIRDYLGLRGVEVQKIERHEIKGRLAVRPPYGVMSTRHYEDFFKDRLRPWEASLKEYVEGFLR
jgi:dTDP-4-dehydrorhamnose reductase